MDNDEGSVMSNDAGIYYPFMLGLIVVSAMCLAGDGAGGASPPCKGGDMVSMPNPATSYCKALGYTWKIVNMELGQVGYCAFPDGSECEEWAFFEGKCAQKFTYCENYRKGKIETTNEKCSFSQECALCVLPDGTKCKEWELCSGKCSFMPSP